MKLFIATILAINAYAAPPKVVGLLCYPSDDLIAGSCTAFEKQMKECGYTVVRVNDFSGDFTKTGGEDAKRLKALPPGAPVFISGHGNSFNKKHYLDSEHGNLQLNKLGQQDKWTVDPAVELGELVIPDDAKVFATDPILTSLEEHPLVLSSCFSGRTCDIARPKLNLIASCSNDETSTNTIVEKKIYQEPVLYWAGELYCKKSVFDSADTDEPKGTLSEKEITRFLAVKMGGKKTVHTIIYPETPNTQPEDVKLNRRIARFPPATAEVRVLDEKLVGKESQRILAELLAKRPGFKGKVIEVGNLYEIRLPDGKKHLLPGSFASPYGAESSAKRWAEHQSPKVTGYKVAAKGKVFEIVLEDTTQACALTGLGTTQTPIIRGTIKGRPTHK